MNAGYRLTFEKGAWEASGVSLDEQGRFTSLLLRPAAPDISYASLDEARAAAAARTGQLARAGGGPVSALGRSEQP